MPPLTISHDGFLRIVLSLTRPVSLLRCSRCIDQSPPCQRGVPRHRRGGGIPQAGKFPHRLVLLESASCESLSHGESHRGLPGRASSLPEGAMGCVPFHIGLLLWESACCGIPQAKIRDFCQLPLAREPLGAVSTPGGAGK